MNIFRFLKSTKGAIKPLNALLISGAAGVGFFFMANTAANHQIKAERQVRASLGELARDNGQYQGGLSSTKNVVDSLNQLATADDLASREGNTALDRYHANQKALGSMESSFGNMDFGQAAQFSDSDSGLGMGNRDAQMENTRFTVGNPRAGVSGGNGSDGYGQNASDGASSSVAGSQNGFTTASMARASGGSSSSSYTPGASGGASGAGAGGMVGGERPRLSGAMPSGTNIVSQRGLEGALAMGGNTANFDKAKNTHGTGGHRTGQGDTELKDILKKSAAAANANASANEGGRAFLSNAHSSGGISVEGGTDTGTATSSDLTAPTARKLKAIGKRMDKEKDKQEERNRKQRQLITQLLITAVCSAGLIIGAAKWLQKLDAAIKVAKLMLSAAVTPYAKAAAAAKLAALTVKRWAVAIGMLTLVTAGNAALFIMAKKFESNYGAYGGTWIATVARLASVITVAAAVQTMFTPDWKGFIKTAWAKIKSGFSSVALGAVTKI